MKRRQPPPTATWVLQHCTPGNPNEAMLGDLLEEFESGRSAGWYRRQVLSAVAIGCLREVVSHRVELLFAALWSMLAPAWLIVMANFEARFNLNDRIWRMDWPWSNLGYMGLLLGTNLIFIWAGVVLYVIPELWAAKSLKVGRLSRGVLASLPVLCVLLAALVVLPGRFLDENQAKYGQAGYLLDSGTPNL